MVLNIIGLSEEKDCDQKILNLIDSVSNMLQNNIINLSEIYLFKLSKDIGMILASQLDLKEAEYLHCIKYRTQEFIGKTYFIKVIYFILFFH